MTTCKKLLQALYHQRLDPNADYWQIANICFSNNGVDFISPQLQQAKIPAKNKVVKLDRILTEL